MVFKQSDWFCWKTTQYLNQFTVNHVGSYRSLVCHHSPIQQVAKMCSFYFFWCFNGNCQTNLKGLLMPSIGLKCQTLDAFCEFTVKLFTYWVVVLQKALGKKLSTAFTSLQIVLSALLISQWNVRSNRYFLPYWGIHLSGLVLTIDCWLDVKMRMFHSKMNAPEDQVD